ncbi:MAG: hypothetical protein CBD51_001160 [Flavobacteriales bacterium TMED191]|nr:MAG: hypothetical protein CBD51_001160 [Flavobacteriales bacterium TMED191]
MKKIFLFFIFPGLLCSQINFSEDISPIIYNNCTECHRIGASGPMPFTSYNEVASLGAMIKYVTESDYMPPWHADTDYSTFLGERGLTDGEKQLISDWVDSGMIQGDPTLEAQIPEFVEGSVIGTPDLVLTMEEPYLIEGNNQDDYRVFVFETNFTEDQYLESIEIIPGNLSAVHHVLVNIDTSGDCASLDASTPEYGYECESGFCVGNIPQLSAGYTPGMVPPLWNNDIGLVLPAGADIAIQMHYAPSSIDEFDQSSVNLFFKDQPVEREVQVETIVDISLQIPANEVYTHYQSFQIPFDMSLISILPHMHLIGKSWLVYAENNGDTIPIISIPNWDFNWQTFYQPEYMLKLPQGYTLHAYATYDNTSSNPTNPNSPPQDMYWCDYTTCEMFFLPFSYVPYQEGDENIYLGNSENLGCTNQLASNYNAEALVDDGSCGILDDCGVFYVPCCFNFNTDECDSSITEENCQNFWADFNVISDPEQNIFWNSTCSSGCTDPVACNYDETILPGGFDDGSCVYAEDYYDCNGECINDLDFDSICDELEIYGCTDFMASNYNSLATEDDGSCNYSCDALEISSIVYNSNQITVTIQNSSFAGFPYPGFILFNSLGDTMAIEDVNFFGIGDESVHILGLTEQTITSAVSLQLFTGFFETMVCEWFDLNISNDCELPSESGECEAAIPAYAFSLSSCYEFSWGGCGGIAPFWTLEECEAACGDDTINILETEFERKLLIEFDVLGRELVSNSQILIRVYDDGTVEKKMFFKN